MFRNSLLIATLSFFPLVVQAEPNTADFSNDTSPTLSITDVTLGMPKAAAEQKLGSNYKWTDSEGGNPGLVVSSATFQQNTYELMSYKDNLVMIFHSFDYPSMLNLDTINKLNTALISKYGPISPGASLDNWYWLFDGSGKLLNKTESQTVTDCQVSLAGFTIFGFIGWQSYATDDITKTRCQRHLTVTLGGLDGHTLLTSLYDMTPIAHDAAAQQAAQQEKNNKANAGANPSL